MDVDLAEGEEGGEKSLGFAGDVLDLVEIDLGDDAIEETMLFGVDDAFVGDNPNVEPIVCEFGESENEHHKEIREESDYEKRTPENVLENGGISEGKDCSYKDRKRYHHASEGKNTEQVDPMTTEKKNNGFVRKFVGKCVKVDHRPNEVPVLLAKGRTSER